MRSSITTTLLFLLACLLLINSGSVQAQVVVGENVDVELIAETETVFAGQQLWVALRLDHRTNWHTYWKNPGDAGLATEISWQLPAGVSAGEIVWPVPERLVWEGLVGFGHFDEAFLLTELNVADSFQAEALDLAADVTWLECDDVCIRRSATVQLSVPFSAANEIVLNQDGIEGFAQTRAALPREDIVLDSMFLIAEGNINLLVQATESIFADARTIRFIPGQDGVFDYAAEQDITTQLSSLQLSQAYHQRVASNPPEQIGGVLLVTDEQGQQLAYQINAGLEGVSLAALDGAPPIFSGSAAGSQLNIFIVFAYAMLGGLILNVMPCVFPVLSLKVLSLVSNSHAGIVQQRRHGLAYAAGVIAAFLVLAVILLALQAGGAAVGWGFQFQSPWFVAAIAVVFFILALGMSSVIELGSGIMGLGSQLADEEGYSGSFYTGLLACVVGSPCTAPFIGPALAFALTQSVVITLAVFIALGLGMALPFLLLSFIPALAAFLPKPGKWMLSFKKILALPLYACVLAAFWVLDKQVSRNALLLVVVSCLGLGLAAWLYQGLRQSTQTWREGKNALSTALIFFCLAGVLGVFVSPILRSGEQGSGLVYEEGVEVYSNAKLDQLRSEGTPVFVNMTAAWCITCLVNERVALNSEVFLDAMEQHNVTYLKGDWTNNDPEITEVLKRYQTSGVPLYLMFPANAAERAQVLPQILTEGIMLEAINVAGTQQ